MFIDGLASSSLVVFDGGMPNDLRHAKAIRETMEEDDLLYHNSEEKKLTVLGSDDDGGLRQGEARGFSQ